MRLLSWNLQGLGNPWTVRSLKHLIRDACPDIIFLMETRLGEGEFEGLKFSLPHYYFFVVGARGRSGGLVLMWKKDISVSICSYSHNHVDFSLCHVNGGSLWRGTGIYGWPEAPNKHKRGNF